MDYIAEFHRALLSEVYHFFRNALKWDVDKGDVELVSSVISLLLILLLAWLANSIFKGFALSLVRSIAKRSQTRIGEHFLKEKFFHRLSHLAPAFIISALSPILLDPFPVLLGIIEVSVNLYLVVIALWSIDALINALHDSYEESSLSAKLPLKGICQAIKLVVNATGVIFILSILLDKSPVYFFSGLGALTAVLLLVFKDVILGLVAGIQLTSNNMVRKGDWVEMPKYGADGDVIDVSLTTVKVQNWDKTITTIPA